MINYFAYGSNMSQQRMKERGLAPISRESAKLAGYELVFNKKAWKGDWGYANIQPKLNSVVEGALYQFPEEDLALLDKVEGFPKHYYRLKLVVTVGSTAWIQAITYVAAPSKIMEGLQPTEEYLQHLLAGRDLLTDAYYQQLVAFQNLIHN